MKRTSKIFIATALAGIATAALAQTPAPPAAAGRGNAQAAPTLTKPGPNVANELAKGPYFTVGPQFPADPNAPPAPARAGRNQAAGAAPGRGQQAGNEGPPRGPNGVPTFGTEDNAALIWEEHWTRAPLTQPMTQANLGNQNLRLHIYGDPAGIRKTQHANEDYTYTGESPNNWAITVSDPQSYWDLRVPGKIMMRTRNTGYRVAHIIIKTSDGKYYASEEGSGESSAWINRDYIFGDLHWRNLTMADAPSNVASATRPVDPKRAVLVPTSVATPDLGKVEEVGFSDLMPGGFIPATLRVNGWALFGKKVPR